MAAIVTVTMDMPSFAKQSEHIFRCCVMYEVEAGDDDDDAISDNKRLYTLQLPCKELFVNSRFLFDPLMQPKLDQNNCN